MCPPTPTAKMEGETLEDEEQQRGLHLEQHAHVNTGQHEHAVAPLMNGRGPSSYARVSVRMQPMKRITNAMAAATPPGGDGGLPNGDGDAATISFHPSHPTSMPTNARSVPVHPRPAAAGTLPQHELVGRDLCVMRWRRHVMMAMTRLAAMQNKAPRLMMPMPTRSLME